MTFSKFPNQLIYLVYLLLVFSCTGATCLPRKTISEFQPPILFQQQPDVQQIAAAVNRSQNVQKLQSNVVSIRFPGNLGSLNANLNYEKEKRFRVQGSASLGLGSVDIGSNDEVFWMGIRQGASPTLFYAQHAQFEQQLNRQILPVSPLWLIEAMGIISIDPYQITNQPTLRPDGLLEVRTSTPSPVGNYTRTLMIDPKYGYVRHLFLNDPNGRLVARSSMSDQQYYSAIEYSLPHRVEVQLIPQGTDPMDMVLEIHQYNVNSLDPSMPNLFQFPDTRGYKVEDLTQINAGQTLPVQAQRVSPPDNPPDRFGYRGYQGPNLVR